MTKPIFTVGLPKHTSGHEVEKIKHNLDSELTEYYILVHTHQGEEINFNCFYEKDFNEVKYEELKKIVKDRLSE
jgi:hypothetical protein